jgi:hypothetical protein
VVEDGLGLVGFAAEVEDLGWGSLAEAVVAVEVVLAAVEVVDGTALEEGEGMAADLRRRPVVDAQAA